MQQALWVGCARLEGEVVTIYGIASVGRQRHAFTGFVVRRARLRKLASHSTHFDYRHRRTVGQNHGHLQHCLYSVANLLCSCVGKGFGTVAALKQESFTSRGISQATAKQVNFTGKHERGPLGKFGLSVS